MSEKENVVISVLSDTVGPTPLSPTLQISNLVRLRDFITLTLVEVFVFYLLKDLVTKLGQ